DGAGGTAVRAAKQLNVFPRDIQLRRSEDGASKGATRRGDSGALDLDRVVAAANRGRCGGSRSEAGHEVAVPDDGKALSTSKVSAVAENVELSTLIESFPSPIVLTASPPAKLVAEFELPTTVADNPSKNKPPLTETVVFRMLMESLPPTMA